MTAADATTSSSPSTAAAIPSNLALLAALLACALAQFLKLFTTWYKEKRWDSKKMLDSGGMPSSHSATVTALTVAVGLKDGTGGPAFAIAFVLACIVMYDASGVRLHAGRQAELLNQIVCELPPEHPLSSVRPLRDSLGHTPLQNGDAANFSIYIHSEPGFVFDEPTTRSAFFHGRQLNNSIQVGWGKSSMIEAERILLQEALRDPANQRFVLLSDSCVPLYNFSYIYNYIISSPKSFVDSFVDGHAFRYDPKMAPTIPKERWRKGSQWIALVRRHAEIIVNDKTVFPVFRKFCKRWPPGDLKWRRKLLAFNFDIKYLLQTFEQKRNCIPDEHYVQTLLAISGLEDELERRALTYTSWNQSAAGSKKRSWHPIKFDFADAGPQKIREIKDIEHVYYESEGRTEFCHANSEVAPCYLFARKFTLGAAVRIMREGLVGPYDVRSKPNIY